MIAKGNTGRGPSVLSAKNQTVPAAVHIADDHSGQGRSNGCDLSDAGGCHSTLDTTIA